MTACVLFDTSVYLDILRSEDFAREFRARYLRDIPRTYLSSVVVQELLAAAHGLRQQRLAAHLYGPFERVRRLVTPTHQVWKDAGLLTAALWRQAPRFRDKLTSGLLNDILVALSGRSIGATVVSRNRGDFELIRSVRLFRLEVI